MTTELAAPEAPRYCRSMVMVDAPGGDDGRTVHARAQAFGIPSEIWEPPHRYVEEWQRGAFRKSLSEGPPEKVKFCMYHDVNRVIGAARRFAELDDGLHAWLAVARTRDGDEALTLLRDGLLTDFSIRFEPIRSQGREIDGHVLRQEVRLREISLVGWPASRGTGLVEIRSELLRPRRSVDEARALLERLRKDPAASS